MIATTVGVVIVLLAWLVDVRLRMEARSSLIQNQERAVTEQKFVLRSELNEIAGSVTALEHIAASGMRSSGSGAYVSDEHLRTELLNVARARQTYDQLRLLDAAGQELITVKRIRSRTGGYYYRETTPDSARDYSVESWMSFFFALPAGKVGFAPLDWKQVDSLSGGGQERVPILRVGGAIQADQGRQVIGYIVLDYLAENLFQRTARTDEHLQTNTFIATADGRWIVGPGGNSVAGLQTVKSVFPTGWSKIASSPSGTTVSREGLIAFETLPLAADAGPQISLAGQPAWKLFTLESGAGIDSYEKMVAAPVKGWAILALCLFIPLTCLIASDREQKREVSRSREKMRALLQSITDSSIDGIVAGEAVRDARGDISDFKTVFANPAAVHILKTFDRKEAADGKEFPLFFSPDFFARCVEVVGTGNRYETEQSAEPPKLGTRWFRIVVVRLDDGVVMTFSDITEQKLTMHELRLAKDAAEVANRTKSQFLTMMGHEIRTPMNGLLGFASLLERTNLDEEQRDYVSTLRLSGEALLRILEDILDYSQMENEVFSMKSAPVAVKELITQVSQLFTMAVGDRRLELVARIAGDVPPQIMGDDVRLRQILVNLIGNAVKFTTEGFILVKVVREQGPKGDFLVFHVVDSGSGIAPEMIDRLFKPFSQVESGSNRRYGGTGLGLSICRRLVETMGGEIGVRTAPDKGSDFYFSVPVRLPEFESVNPAPITRKLREASRKPRILVVDDDLINRKLIMRMIEKVGAEAELVESGSEAIHAFQESEFDLIIMDIQMPGMDGIETTRRIREIERNTGALRRTPISALTANAGEGDREKCFEAGMDDFFCKPIRIDSLERLIEKNTT